MRSSTKALLMASTFGILSSTASAQVDLILSTIPNSSTNVLPPQGVSQPPGAFTVNFGQSFGALSLSPDGTQWVIGAMTKYALIESAE